ncbi:unnamed protein product [Ectocarpus sp. CCAP 1310/34]|nr:unnamed protein product [Ectocarpus sp. CCAP 1310/34]
MKGSPELPTGSAPRTIDHARPADDIPLTIARAPDGRLSALQQHHFCY